MLTTFIVCVFVLGYVCIALEDVVKVNKAVPALVMCVLCWILFTFGAGDFIALQHPNLLHEAQADIPKFVREHLLIEHLGDIAGTLFFLMGAMTVVEIIDTNGGFNFVRDLLAAKTKRGLLWKLGFATFFLSAVLDNLTTSIVMVMVLRKLVHNHNDRMLYASFIIIAANAGGAFSPIGDVTTIMLWLKGCITTGGVIEEIFVPSLMAMVVPALLLSLSMKGELPPMDVAMVEEHAHAHQFGKTERNIIFCVGVGGLLFVPIFHSLTHLPPYMGILLVLGLLWGLTEIFYRSKAHRDSKTKMRVTEILKKIDMTTILFFLGILLAVATLKETGVLPAFGAWLDSATGSNHYLVTGIIGVASAIVDNVPLVAGCMNMYPIAGAGELAQDGIFWQLLAYCAGVGGSMLIIGSAAGVVVMGLEKISFGWYMKRISWLAAAGYFAGMATYYGVDHLLAALGIQ